MSDDQTTQHNEPQADRPTIPQGYGVPDSDEGLLPWSWAEERLLAADNYWVSTTRPDGRPHAVPSWGVWLDGKFYFESDPSTRRMRNIAENPAINVHINSGDEIVILEGTAEQVENLDSNLSARLLEAFEEKYKEKYDYTFETQGWENGGLYFLAPKVAFAWNKFPADTTRWRFKGE